MTDKTVPQNSLVSILPKSGKLSKTAWELPDNLTESDWVAAGNALSHIEGAMNWWLGDWWRFGEHKYGERKAILDNDDWNGPAYQTCKDAGWVCGFFEKSLRKDLLSWNHHKAAAALPLAEAINILEWAEETGASVRDTQAKVKEIKSWLAQGWAQSQLERRKLIEQGITVVASLRKGADDKQIDAALLAWADQQNLLVKIDRNTDWGNPFEMPSDGDRDTVCDNYARHYLPYKPSLLKKIPILKGKVLVCWCHPERCHGDHLAHLANKGQE